jgi:hypothetical protein
MTFHYPPTVPAISVHNQWHWQQNWQRNRQRTAYRLPPTIQDGLFGQAIKDQVVVLFMTLETMIALLALAWRITMHAFL